MSQYPSPYSTDPLRPVPPQRNTGKLVAGGALAVFAALMALGALLQLLTGHLFVGPGMRVLGQLIGLALFVGLPGWGAYRLLTSHQRELRAWEAEVEENRRQRRLTGGF